MMLMRCIGTNLINNDLYSFVLLLAYYNYPKLVIKNRFHHFVVIRN